MLILSVTIISALFLYWFSGGFYVGPRYWFGLLVPILFWSAAGFDTLSERLEKLNVTNETAMAVLMFLCLFGLSVFTTWRGVEKFYDYGDYGQILDPLTLNPIVGNTNAWQKTHDNNQKL